MHFKVPFFILFYLLVGSYQLFAETNVNLQKPRLTEDTEYIMEMRLPNGQLISEAIVVYKFDDTWYIPLGEVSNLFGLSLSYSPMMSRVEGRILNVHESFVLDLKKCVVNGKKIRILAERDPSKLPWGKENVQVVLEVFIGKFFRKQLKSGFALQLLG